MNALHAAYYADQAVQVAAEIVETVRLARDTYRVRFHAPEIARRIVPGQFVMLRIAGLNDPLWSLVPYMKGAFFLRAVATRIGEEELDQSLATFYQANVGKAAKMDALIEQIKADNPDDATAIDTLADKWLRELRCPVQLSTLCTDN